MNENPKIVFEGKDNISPAAHTANQSIKDLSKTILDKSLAESNTSKQAFLNYEKEIYIIKQKIALEQTSKKESLKESYERKIQEIRNDKQEAEKLSKDKTAPREDRISAKRSLKDGVFEKAEEGAGLRYEKELKTVENSFKETQKQTKFLEEQLRQFKLLAQLLAAGGGKDEDSYKKLLTELNIEGPGEKFAEKIKKEQETKEKKEPGVFSGVFWGNMAAEIAKSVGKTILNTPLNMARQTYGALMSGKEGEQSAADITRALPFGIGEGVSATLSNWMEALEAKQKAGAQYQAISGGESFTGGSGLGFKFEESSQINQALAKSRGSVEEMKEEAAGAFRLIKGLGLDISTISQTASTYRYQENPRTAEQNISVLMKTMGIKEGTKEIIRMQELLEIQNKLVEEEAGKLEKVSPETISSVIAAFDRFGGSYADKRAGERIMSINQGLTNPQNEYQQAMSYATLAGLKPGASLLDIMKMQEKGVKQPGYMQETMKMYANQHGTGDLFTIALKNRFNLSAEQAETLSQGWREGKDFSKIGEKGVIPGQIQKTYGTSADYREVREAALEAAFAKGPLEGLTESFNQLGDAATKIKDKLLDMLGIDLPW
jgi:uncharacterized protein YneF (UPF0154 family)